MALFPGLEEVIGSREFWARLELIAPGAIAHLERTSYLEKMQLRVAGFEVEAANGEALLEELVDAIEAAIDEDAAQLMRVTLYRCGECEGVSSSEAWQAAWWSERSRRILEARRDPEHEYHEAPSSSDYGLDDRMVCPRCKHVHTDDDTSYVDEVPGRAEAIAL